MEARNSHNSIPLVPPASTYIDPHASIPENPEQVFSYMGEISVLLDGLYESHDEEVVMHLYEEQVPGEFRMNVFRKVGESYLISIVHSADISEQGIQTTNIVFDRSGAQTQILLAKQNIGSDDEATQRTAPVINILTKKVEVQERKISKEKLLKALISTGETVTKDPNAKWVHVEDVPTLEAIKALFPDEDAWRNAYNTSMEIDNPQRDPEES